MGREVRRAGIALLLLAAGCARSRSACGAGGAYQPLGDTDICVYEAPLVIEGGFDCPPALRHRVDFDGGTVCSSQPLEARALDSLCDALGGDCSRAPDVPSSPPRTDVRDAGPGDDPRPPPSEGRHAQCAAPFPSDPPPPPQVNRADDGSPAFDSWRDIDCAAAAAQASLCSEWTSSRPDECGSCLTDPVAQDGVCASADIDVWCDGEGEVVGLAAGCYICAAPAARARACCEGLAFDCRAWPYPADGARGTVCARHADCEPGLVCGAPGDGAGYGICRCPEEPALPWSEQCEQQIVRR